MPVVFRYQGFRLLVEVAQTHRELIERAWHDYFG
jgi:hypothetical protein